MSEEYYDLLQKKYPNGYFEHFITMFQGALDDDGYKEHAKIYLDIEGMEGYEELIEEIQEIEKCNDWQLFVELAREFEMEHLNIANIKELAVVAIEAFRDLSK